ncbi:MAG: T9SS type A sorting domain-containing protein [Bacteroidota bacterium]
MKGIYCTAAVLLSLSLSGQNTPFAIWEDQANSVYRFVKMDATTGTRTNIAILPNMTGFMAGDISALNTDSNYYHYGVLWNSNYYFITIDLGTGAVVYSAQLNAQIAGIEYNCADSALYGIRFAGTTHYFMKIDPASGAITVISQIPGATATFIGNVSLDVARQRYIFKAQTPTGPRLKALDIASGNVVYDNPFPDNVSAHKYSLTDSAVYGLWEDNNLFKLEKIDYTNGTHSTVAVLNGISPGLYLDCYSINPNGEYTFRGFSGSTPTIFTLDAGTGLIINSSPCPDNAFGYEEPLCAGAPSSVNGSGPVLSFSVWPNPAKDRVQICLPDDVALDLAISLYTGTGQLLSTLHVQSTDGKAGIDLFPYPAGLYFLVIRSANTLYTSKLVIDL